MSALSTSFARTAILGTQHAVPTLDVGDRDANALVARRAGDDSEIAMLRAAALVATVRRAEVRAHRFVERDEPAPDETLPCCGPEAAAVLRTILHDGQPESLSEWLSLAARFGRRAPEEHVPALLARGVASRYGRSAILSATGNRGRWFARREPAWAYAIENDDPEKRFSESGDRADRIRHLTSLRGTDPARARDLLESSWAKEASYDRAPLLEALATGLGPADEAFLERARGDKRKDVRSAAHRLLQRLPDSQRARRAMARAESMLALRRSPLGRRSLEVTLPASCSPEMVADGIENAPLESGGGIRESLLVQNIQLVPVKLWLARFDVTLKALFELAGTTEYGSALLRAFSTSIGTYRDQASLDALYDMCANDMTLLPFARIAHGGFDRTEHVESTQSDESPFLRTLRNVEPEALQFLALATRPWSVELSAAALEATRRGIEKNDDWRVHTSRAATVGLLMQYVDPQTPGMLDGWPETFAADHTRQLVDRLLHKLAFRAEIYIHLKDGT